jgi:hypothetical protein
VGYPNCHIAINFIAHLHLSLLLFCIANIIRIELSSSMDFIFVRWLVIVLVNDAARNNLALLVNLSVLAEHHFD